MNKNTQDDLSDFKEEIDGLDKSLAEFKAGFAKLS
tara:strand:- start:4 stop:108 length:105 start_codon:yes stop_codon:yes gene_type:complete